MPLSGLEKLGNREPPTDEVFRPWAETMPAPDPADEIPRARPSPGQGFAFIAVAVSLASFVFFALRKLFRR
ncbi:MAG: hypothetical protein H7337_14305 [Rhizobacter sp.]|nr:hypothetical protein [Rhizobacter sp.]